MLIKLKSGFGNVNNWDWGRILMENEGGNGKNKLFC